MNLKNEKVFAALDWRTLSSVPSLNALNGRVLDTAYRHKQGIAALRNVRNETDEAQVDQHTSGFESFGHDQFEKGDAAEDSRMPHRALWRKHLSVWGTVAMCYCKLRNELTECPNAKVGVESYWMEDY